jgi:hypothetical protein
MVKMPYASIESAASKMLTDTLKLPYASIESAASKMLTDTLWLRTLDLGIGSTYVTENVDGLLGTLDIESSGAASQLVNRERNIRSGNQPESVDERLYALTMIAIATMIAAVGCLFATQHNDPQAAMGLALAWLAFVCWFIDKA